jgi:tetratricopeptide (TPR) repeat protein
MQNNFDRELQNYFTDVEHLREMFRQWMAVPALPKRMLVIHGVGGVGKSSLLRMFRLHCKSVGVPVALASGDEQKSALEVLTRWADDLKADGVRLPEFDKTFQQYRAIQAKVENEATKVAGKLAKGAAATVVETVASTIPGIGPLVGKLGGMGAEALVDWLRGFLTKPDIELLLDPAKKLTADFLADLQKAADRRRIVLMLDTFEQMTALEDWAREVAQQLPANVLLVIAGRALPNWDRAWPGWMANAQVEELKPMTEEVMRELIQRYYATMRGGQPNPAQVEAIIRFARGLPMVVTSAVQLWVKYGVEDFQAVKPEIVANLVDRLMEGVPKAMVPALESAAAVRWFDQPILRAVMAQEDVRDAYNELRRFPFVRTRAEGLALHDAVREIVDENLRVQDAERHRELHERAAAYFEKRLEKATGEEAERLGLERLYHRIRADEETGIQLFQEMAEELVRYRLVNRLRALLNDVNTYPLERENSRLWREYYRARLSHLMDNPIEAEITYQAIIEKIEAESKLRAYALHDLGTTLRGRRISTPNMLTKIISCFERSLSMQVLDNKLVKGVVELAPIYRDMGDWDKALKYLNKGLQFFQENNDLYNLASVYNAFKWYYIYRGDWRNAFDMQSKGLEIVKELGESRFLRQELLSPPAFIWMGRFNETEKSIREATEIRIDLGLWWDNGNLSLATGLNEKFDEAVSYISTVLENQQMYSAYSPRGTAIAMGWFGIILLRKGEIARGIEMLEKSAYVKEEIQDTSYLLETLIWLGIGNEILQCWDDAAKCYTKNLSEYRWTGRLYFHCAALTGLIRVKHAQGDYAAIPPLLAEAEGLAQQYEYNDHLASLRLMQGHLAWEGITTDKIGLNGQTTAAGQSSVQTNQSVVIGFFQQAMIYALRYNRFLLDEVLSGRPQGTPLRPIIPECLKRGEEGRRMLIALRDWWQTGVNDIGTPRPDTISPIPEGIPLLEAERIAREREPGDGTPQKSVVEQIEAALKNVEAG